MMERESAEAKDAAMGCCVAHAYAVRRRFPPPFTDARCWRAGQFAFIFALIAYGLVSLIDALTVAAIPAMTSARHAGSRAYH